jgi:DNA-binding NtrC family response regulator
VTHILVAESDRQIREFISGILTDFGHDVTACEDCTEAAARLTIGPIDVLVTDVVLRDAEGSSFCKHCVTRGIRTITLSGHEFRDAQAEQDCPPPLVEKPFRLDDLQDVVDAVAAAARSRRAAA